MSDARANRPTARLRRTGKGSQPKYAFKNILPVLPWFMAWVVIFHEAFDAEFLKLPRDVQTALAAKARLLESIGPMLGRPHVDTLKDSRHGNMKELRFDAPSA